MQLDLKSIPFGRRLSRHLIYEETDRLGAGWTRGLYLAVAAESTSSFTAGPATGPKGFLRITPVSGGRRLEYTYSASPGLVQVDTDAGSLRFAMDGTKVLRIDGRGVGLRLDGKLAPGGNALLTARGIELLQATDIYLIKALKGTLALDCHWELKALHASDPVVTVLPDADGTFELAVFDTDDKYVLPELAENLDRCAADSEADFGAFADRLVKTPSQYNAFFEAAAYALWSGIQTFKGKNLVCAHKLTDQKFYAIEQPLVSLSMADPSAALDVLGGMLDIASPQGMVPVWAGARQNLYEATAPLYGYAVNCLIEKGALSAVPQDKLSAFYDAMSKAVTWWLTQRRNSDGLCYYGYRHECGWPAARLFGCGLPAVTPDLAAYLFLAAEALSKLAAALGETDDAAFWTGERDTQYKALTETLRDGESFRCVNALTGETGVPEGLLSLVPLLLGKRLPGAILETLARKAAEIDWRTAPILPASLVILGLKDAGFDAEAASAAEALLRSCTECGANDTRGRGLTAGTLYSPAACAALLALGSRVLQ